MVFRVICAPISWFLPPPFFFLMIANILGEQTLPFITTKLGYSSCFPCIVQSFDVASEILITSNFISGLEGGVNSKKRKTTFLCRRVTVRELRSYVSIWKKLSFAEVLALKHSRTLRGGVVCSGLFRCPRIIFYSLCRKTTCPLVLLSWLDYCQSLQTEGCVN